jgi:ABC-type polysaccharide/polyol phosphate export permease
MTAIAAIILRDLRVARRYPLSMINLVLLTPLYQMAIPTLLLGTAFLVEGSAVGLSQMVGTTDLVGWLGLGVLVASLVVGVMWTVADDIMTDRMTGVLEHSWTTPTRREVFVVGTAGTSFIFTMAASALLMLFGVLVLDARYAPLGLLLSVPVLAVMLVGVCGFGYLGAAGILSLRKSSALLDTTGYLLSTFSGVSFPLTVLPTPLREVTYLLPTTWGLDLMRHLSLGTETLLALPVACGALVVTSVGVFALGRIAFLRAERGLRTAGTLAQF